MYSSSTTPPSAAISSTYLLTSGHPVHVATALVSWCPTAELWGERPPLPRRLVKCRLKLESHCSSAAVVLVLQAPYRASLGRQAVRVGCQFSFRDRWPAPG